MERARRPCRWNASQDCSDGAISTAVSFDEEVVFVLLLLTVRYLMGVTHSFCAVTDMRSWRPKNGQPSAL